MSDNVAILEGFTQEAVASCDATDLYLLIKPGTDLDSTFRAWDTDEQEFITVNGWLFTFEFAKPEIETFVDYDTDEGLDAERKADRRNAWVSIAI